MNPDSDTAGSSSAMLAPVFNDQKPFNDVAFVVCLPIQKQ